jgi:hypothetical protein
LFFINQIFFSSKMAKEVPYNKYEFWLRQLSNLYLKISFIKW